MKGDAEELNLESKRGIYLTMFGAQNHKYADKMTSGNSIEDVNSNSPTINFKTSRLKFTSTETAGLVKIENK